MPDVKASRKVRAIVIGAVVAGLVGVVLWPNPWAEPATSAQSGYLAEQR